MLERNIVDQAMIDHSVLEQVVPGIAGGLLAALYVSIFLAALLSKRMLGSVLVALMAIWQALTSIFAINWLPDPTPLLALVGIDGTLEMTPPGIWSLLVSMLCGVAIAHFTGFIRFLRRCMDRLGAALAARFAGPGNPMDPA